MCGNSKKKVDIKQTTENEFKESGSLINNYTINHRDILHFDL